MKKELVLHRDDLQVILHKEGDLINLTDVWKAAGSPKGKEVWNWLENDQARGFILAVCKLLNLPRTEVIKTKRGKGGGTWGHQQVALEYAQYLDPKLAVALNQVAFERIEEEKNPELIIDRAVETYRKKGKSDEWIDRRIKGKLKRKEFTKTLASHGVQTEGFRNCTNEIYRPLFGGSSAVVRAKKNLPAKASIRDNLSSFELDAVNFSESTATQMIDAQGLHGNAECEIACGVASKAIKDAIMKAKNTDIKSMKK